MLRLAISLADRPFIVVADFNGDGKPDLVTSGGGAQVSVLLGNGDGTFQAAVNYGVGSGPVFCAAGDFNGDGKADLAVVNSIDNNVSVLLGKGDGTFQPAINYGLGNYPSGTVPYPSSIVVADFNGDGKADLIVGNSAGNSVSEMLGNGDGTLAAAVHYSTGGEPITVGVGDFNGDGKPGRCCGTLPSVAMTWECSWAMVTEPLRPLVTYAAWETLTSSAVRITHLLWWWQTSTGTVLQISPPHTRAEAASAFCSAALPLLTLQTS